MGRPLPLLLKQHPLKLSKLRAWENLRTRQLSEQKEELFSSEKISGLKRVGSERGWRVYESAGFRAGNRGLSGSHKID